MGAPPRPANFCIFSRDMFLHVDQVDLKNLASRANGRGVAVPGVQVNSRSENGRSFLRTAGGSRSPGLPPHNQGIPVSGG
ncbi:hypothetical protein AAY473_011831 [Plecturocebus cupreus]